MAYDSVVMQRAKTRMEENRRRREYALENRRAEIELRVPRVAEIDRMLGQTLAKVALATLRGNGDPASAIEALRDENLALQKEREQLLNAAGYPGDVLDDKPDCPKCGDTGWIGRDMCDCMKIICAQEQVKVLSKTLDLGEQDFRNFRLDYYSAEIDPAMGCSPRENMSRVLELCRNYAQNFGKYYFKNLFLYGAPGLGKTFISACIARTVAENGHSVVYESAANVFAAFETAKFSRNEEEGEAAREDTERYLKCDLLILDDLGSELTTAMTQANLYHLINTRLVSGKSTVISSNMSLDDVRRRYLPQIASRLEGEYRTLPFRGEDIRLKRFL